MITVKEAVQTATGFFADLFPNVHDLRLEEVDMSEGGPWWDVTVSFEAPGGQAMRSDLALRPESTRSLRWTGTQVNCEAFLYGNHEFIR